MRKHLNLAWLGFILTISAVAQTVVQTSGTTTVGTVPVFGANSNTTVTNSPISVSGGKVGIGTMVPVSTLDVNAVENIGTNHGVKLTENGGSSWANQTLLSTGWDTTNGDWSKISVPGSASNSASIFLNQFGRVGIGTTSPGAKVDIWAGSEGQAAPVTSLLIEGPNAPTNFNSAQEISWSFHSAGSSRIRAFRGGSWDTYLQFLTNSDGQGSDTPQVRMHIDQSGRVGIGTTSPERTLHIKGDVQIDGNLYFSTNQQPQSAPYAGSACQGGDYAESIDVTGDRTNYTPGDVLVIDPDNPGKFLKSVEPYSTAVMGIYSTKPGVLGRRQLTEKSPDEVPMAMVGIVPTKVSAENGPIRPGDLLVSSSTPGYAMKGTDRSKMLGAVLGKALASLESGRGLIEVGVTLQ